MPTGPRDQHYDQQVCIFENAMLRDMGFLLHNSSLSSSYALYSRNFLLHIFSLSMASYRAVAMDPP